MDKTTTTKTMPMPMPKRINFSNEELFSLMHSSTLEEELECLNACLSTLEYLDLSIRPGLSLEDIDKLSVRIRLISTYFVTSYCISEHSESQERCSYIQRYVDNLERELASVVNQQEKLSPMFEKDLDDGAEECTAESTDQYYCRIDGEIKAILQKIIRLQEKALASEKKAQKAKGHATVTYRRCYEMINSLNQRLECCIQSLQDISRDTVNAAAFAVLVKHVNVLKSENDLQSEQIETLCKQVRILQEEHNEQTKQSEALRQQIVCTESILVKDYECVLKRVISLDDLGFNSRLVVGICVFVAIFWNMM